MTGRGRQRRRPPSSASTRGEQDRGRAARSRTDRSPARPRPGGPLPLDDGHRHAGRESSTDDEKVATVDVSRFDWEHCLRAEPAITGTRLLVLLALGTWMTGETGADAFMSQKTLAAATGQKERSVRGHLLWAMKHGWLKRVRRGHRRGDGTTVSSLYQAAVPAHGLLSTGDPLPLEDLNRHHTSSQPARSGASTGTWVPPTKQVDQSLLTNASTGFRPPVDVAPWLGIDEHGNAVPRPDSAHGRRRTA